MGCSKWKVYSFISVVIAAFLLGFFWLGPIWGKSDKVEWPDYGEEKIPIVYTSEVKKEDCTICGTPMNLHRGEDNLGIISMHCNSVSYIGINRYDDWGRLIKEPDSGIGMNINSVGKSGLMTVVTANSTRGYADADIRMGDERVLNMETAAQYYCTLCLNRIISEISFRDPYGVGLINYKTGEIKLFSENTRGFMLGDFYVSCNSYAEGDEEEITAIDLQIFYCPERYK